MNDALQFNPIFYLIANPDVAAAGVDPLEHYLLAGRQEERLANDPNFDHDYASIAGTALFDHDFYRKHVPALSDAVDPLAHYVVWGRLAFLDPSAEFSSAEYYIVNPDVRHAGINPLSHYIFAGRSEQRHTTLADREKKRTRFRGYAVGADQGELTELEWMRGTAFLYRYNFCLNDASRLQHVDRAVADLAARPVELPIKSRSPDVSIIIPTFGQLPVLLNCLDSLVAQHSRYTAEIIVMDDASPSETRIQTVAAIPWIRYLRHERNKGFVASCNSAAMASRGRYLIFLNNDTRVVAGWLDELIGSFDLFPRAALVGSKLVNENRTLQEAGGIVWRDGAVWNYGRGDHPMRPEYSFAREVDYCSGASLAVSTNAWREVGGFDSFYAPAYCEDLDLAFALRRAGFETWFQPLSTAIHYEGKSHGRDVGSSVKSNQVKNLDKFYGRWRDSLTEHSPPTWSSRAEANRKKVERVLILDAQTPTPDRDAGSTITYQIITLFLHMGWHVSFAPRDPSFLGNYTKALQRLGVEMLIEPCFSGVKYQSRADFYDLIFAFRYESITDCYAELRAAYPKARIVFHDIDLHFLRLERKAEVFEERATRIEAQLVKEKELDLIEKCDCTVLVTDIEKAIVQAEVPAQNIVVYPYTIECRRSERSFEDRRHLCFIGNFAHDPNTDAVLHFVRDIWPLVKPTLPAETKFLIIGQRPSEKVQSLAADDIAVMGYVPRLEEIMDDCRLSVAPLRYGAGIKGKLIQSLAFGLPAVATSLAAEGMPLEHQRNVLIADTKESFARAITELFHQHQTWLRLQTEGYAFVEENYSWRRGLATLQHILDVADDTWISRRRFVKKAAPRASRGIGGSSGGR